MNISPNKLSDNERDQFLRVMQESLTVDRHSQLFLWLQGEFQRFLPHEVLIAVTGDFSGDHLQFDITSAAHGVRGFGCAGCAGCEQRPISDLLFDRWRNHQRRMLAFNGDLAELLNFSCSCPMADHMRNMRAALVHGLRDERSGVDAMYIVLRAGPPFDDQQRKMFALLMPHIDHICRRIVGEVKVQPHVPVIPTPMANAASVITFNGTGLSSRELEILEWVRAGKTNSEIGMILNISPFTVKNHMQRIFRKIDVLNRTQAVAKVEGFWRASDKSRPPQPEA